MSTAVPYRQQPQSTPLQPRKSASTVQRMPQTLNTATAYGYSSELLFLALSQF